MKTILTVQQCYGDILIQKIEIRTNVVEKDLWTLTNPNPACTKEKLCKKVNEQEL